MNFLYDSTSNQFIVPSSDPGTTWVAASSGALTTSIAPGATVNFYPLKSQYSIITVNDAIGTPAVYKV